MGARDEHFEGAASSGADVLWQYRVTVDIDGEPVQLIGEGLSLEDAACDVVRQVTEPTFV